MKKILNLLNLKKWADGFLMSAFLRKFVQGMVVAGLAYLAPYITKLQEHGVTVQVDQDAIVVFLVAVIGGVLNGLGNTAKHGPLKTKRVAAEEKLNK